MTDEDPFSAFGDSDSEDNEELEDNEATRIARSLVDLANVRTLASVAETATDGKTIEDAQQRISETNRPDDALGEQLNVPWPAPLYVGPMKFVSSLPFGGGRGCVAVRNLPPGTLLMVEEPLASWPVEENRIDLPALQALIDNDNAVEIMRSVEHLHPTKTAVDGKEHSDPVQVAEMLTSLRGQHSEDPLFPLILKFAQESYFSNSDRPTLTETDILRMLLALQYNGLESGLFCFSAMLNHADQPNCVKFLPEGGQEYSEIRTTRPVAMGEALTISYVPHILSHASRRTHLWNQHRFDIGTDVSPALMSMEKVGKYVPSSSISSPDDDSTTRRVELALAELNGISGDAFAVCEEEGSAASVAENAKALEQASLELFNEAKHQLQNENHLLLLPCLRLHVDSCDIVQRDLSLSDADRRNLLCRLIVSSKKLRELQIMFHGPDHFDIARTDLDLAQAIEELLSSSAKHATALKLEGLNSMSAWAALEHQMRTDYNRIKALYPRDADKYVQLNE